MDFKNKEKVRELGDKLKTLITNIQVNKPNVDAGEELQCSPGFAD